MRYLLSLILCFIAYTVSATDNHNNFKTRIPNSEPLRMVNYTYDNGVWSPNNPSGSSTSIDQITILSGQATLSTDTDADTVIIKPGASLTIPSSVTLTVTTEVLLESVSNSYSSLILDGVINGPVKYERFVSIIGTSAGGGNDLITAPLDGERFEDFALANEGILAAQNDLRAFAPYMNATSSFLNYSVITNAETPVESGRGYRAATWTGAPLVFTGNANIGLVNVPITAEAGSGGKLNLIGNPYPCYLSAADFLNHVGASGQSNLEILAFNSAAIYGYNAQAIDNHDIVNLSNMAEQLIAPGQGFYVTTNTNNTIEFAPYMRRAGDNDDFVAGRSAIPQKIELTLSGNGRSHDTSIYFNSNASLALDQGYDARVWGGVLYSFMLYSQLPSGTGVPLGLQTLNTDQLNEVVSIPLGVRASAGESLTFSLSENTTPSTVEYYLEDTANNTITLLNNSDYNVTPASSLSGSNRFVLKINDNTLSENTINEFSVRIYNPGGTHDLVFEGLSPETGQIYIYDFSGRLILNKTLNNSPNLYRLSNVPLSSGTYVVVVEQNGYKTEEKIIIN